MMKATKETTDKTAGAEIWYNAAARTAAVAGVFSAAVCALLLWNYLQAGVVDPLDSKKMADLRADLPKHPTDAKLKKQIREFDLAIRQQHFQSRSFAVTGGYLLAGGLAVFLLSLKYAANFRRKLPNPKAKREEDFRRAGAMSRGSVAALAAVLCGGAVAVFVLSQREAPWEKVREADAAPPPTGQAPGEVKTATPSAAPVTDPKKAWPRFRGPDGLGISAFTDAPTKWNGKTGEGILWKAKVPLPGQNSPVVWGDRVFVTGADSQKREVYCFNADTGALVWRKPVEDVPGSGIEAPQVNGETGYAASTAATDGQRVYAIFANGDVACFDYAGKQVWARGFDNPLSAYGHASSLAIWKNLLLVQLDQAGAEDGKSMLRALDCLNGGAQWEARRPVPNSWTSPIVINAAGRDQVITAAQPWVISYDAATGDELWRADCLRGDVAPSPVYADGLVFACNDGSNLAAIRPDGQGDVTKTHVAWTAGDGLPDICSPLATAKEVYLVGTFGKVTCYDAKTGKKIGEKEFEGEFNSSPSLVGNSIYLLDKKGVMHIFETGGTFKDVATANLGEEATTCPAFLDGRIYIRGKKNLYCIGKRQ